MNLQNLTRDIDRLSAADAVVADSYVRHVLSKTGLYLLAGIIAVAGIALLELSAFWLLEESIGAAGAAALIGVIDCLLAAVILLLAIQLRPGREFSLALTMRKSAIESLEQHVSTPGGPQGGIQSAAYPMSEALVSSVILPLVATLIRSFRTPRPEKPALNAELAADLKPETDAGAK
jgi:hypothetical protein